MPDGSDADRSKDLLFLLAENSNDVVWTMAVTGEITYVSPSVERMRGITPEEAMRQPLEEIFPPESAAIVAGYFQELYGALAEGREPPGNFRGELEYRCVDGSTVWTEVQVMPRYGRDGGLREILGVSRDISELREQRAATREAQLEAERQRALVDERERMARELHDDLLQTLAVVGMDIAKADLRIDDPAPARAALDRAREDLATATDSARRLVLGLRARQLDGRDLGDAIRQLAAEFAKRTELDIDVVSDDIGELCAAVEDALFRVAQESFANIVKHAAATAVSLRLVREADSVVLTVEDDGRGFDPAGRRRDDAFGVAGMRERVEAVQGSLVIESDPGVGTRIAARVPAAAI